MEPPAFLIGRQTEKAIPPSTTQRHEELREKSVQSVFRLVKAYIRMEIGAGRELSGK